MSGGIGQGDQLSGRGFDLGQWAVKSYLAHLSFLLLACPLFARSSSQTSEFKISVDVDLVLLDISVKDAKDAYVSGLGKEDFKIYENGILQKITQFDNSDIPVTIGLVIDESGSIRSKRPEVLTAGLVFVNASNPKDEIFVVNFNDKVRSALPEAIPFTDDPRLLRIALARDKPEGKTALYDAIAFALAHLESGRRGKKALIVLSDGGDNCSRHTFTELMEFVEKSRATVYTVGIFDSDDPERNPGVLARIAKISGGESFLPDKLDEIIRICQKIAADIRNRYTVGYAPVHVSGESPVRQIRVVIGAKDRGRLRIRTRSSYVLP